MFFGVNIGMAISEKDKTMIKRRKSKQIQIGDVKIGGDAPISVQSMCNTDTRDIQATVNQIKELEDAGCELILPLSIKIKTQK